MNAQERKAWLADRQMGIGGTDIASIAGVGFLTAEEVYAEKVAPEPVDRPPSPLMLMGLATEDLNAARYTERTGRKLYAPGLVRAEVLPWLYATYDRVVSDVGEDCHRPVELKYTPWLDESEWGPDGTDEVPDGYIVQVTWQLAVLAARGHPQKAGDLAALDARANQRVYTIGFDNDLAALLLELGEGFWHRVQHRLGLDGWEPKVRGAVAEKLVKIRPETTTALDTQAELLADSYAAHKAQAKESEACAESCKQQLVAILGEYETGILPDGRRVRQRELVRKSYTVEETKYRQFSILKAKKGKPSDE